MSGNDKPPIAFLSGERVYLRPFESDDIPQLLCWLNDPAVWRTLGVFLPVSEKTEQEFVEIANSGKDNIVYLAIALHEGNRLIGSMGLKDIIWKDRSATFGIFIGPAECRSQGYGTEATRLLLDYAFRTLNLNRIGLEVFANNAAAIRVYEKVGFVREGVQRERRFLDGKYVDQYLYGILAREFNETHPNSEPRP